MIVFYVDSFQILFRDLTIDVGHGSVNHYHNVVSMNFFWDLFHEFDTSCSRK